MNQSIQAIENRVIKADSEGITRSRQLGNRAEELSTYARVGYRLAHTAVIEGIEFVTFIDTLTREND